METSVKRFVIVLVFLAMSLGGALSTEAEVKDLGEICFIMFPDIIFEGSGGQLQVGVMSFGANHFVLDGRVGPIYVLGPRGHVSGSASLDGDTITMTLTGSDMISQVSPRSGTFSSLHIVLDAATGSGSWTALSFGFKYINTSLVVTPQVGGGTIHVAPCWH